MAFQELWQYISGSFVLHPTSVVEGELKKREKDLYSGLLHFKPPSNSVAKLTAKKLDAKVIDHVKILSKFLVLDEEETYNQLLEYLLSRKNSDDLLAELSQSSESQREVLLLRVRDSYFRERTQLMRCVKHVLTHWWDEQHPLQEVYMRCMERINTDNALGKKLLEQYKSLSATAIPDWQSHGKYMTDAQTVIWATQNLREQCDVLECLMLYYKEFEMPADTLICLLDLFKKHNMGWHLPTRRYFGNNTACEALQSKNSILCCLLLLQGLDLDTATSLLKQPGNSEHPLLSSSATLKKIDDLVKDLSEVTPASPVLLSWSLLKKLCNKGADKSLAVRALRHDVFKYVNSSLSREPLSGDNLLSQVACSVIYSMFSFLLSEFHEDSLGDPESIVSACSKLLKRRAIAADFWNVGLSGGCGPLLRSTTSKFPLESQAFLLLLTSLTEASTESAKQAREMSDAMELYTEMYDETIDAVFHSEGHCQLVRPRAPWGTNYLVIPSGIIGALETPGLEDGTNENQLIVQWNFEYKIQQLHLATADLLLRQVSAGAGVVSPYYCILVTQCNELLAAQINNLDVRPIPDLVDIIYSLLYRFSRLRTHLEIIASCVQVIAALAKSNPAKVIENLEHTKFLPVKVLDTGSSESISVQRGLCGDIMNTTEMAEGEYPATIALLQLLANSITPLGDAGQQHLLSGCVQYVLQEIFPSFARWRYNKPTTRQTIGVMCLRLFHVILMQPIDEENERTASGLEEQILHHLLYSDAGSVLLDIVSTGTEAVDRALARQSSAHEGPGSSLIQLIWLGFSVLNRVLLMNPPDMKTSIIEAAFQTHPTSQSERQLVSRIAHYIDHKHDPRLPRLATILLTRLAETCTVSQLACFGSEASTLRDAFLARLKSASEDPQLKCGVYEWLSTCVEHQPGLVDLFLRGSSSRPSPSKKTKTDEPADFLRLTLSLIAEELQTTSRCPAHLLCAVLQLLASLWTAERHAGLKTLTSSRNLWSAVGAPLFRDITTSDNDDDGEQATNYERKSLSSVFKILAEELFKNDRNLKSAQLKEVFDQIHKQNRFEEISKMVSSSVRTLIDSPPEVQRTDAQTVIPLLNEWKSLLIVLTNTNACRAYISDKTKLHILQDLFKDLLAVIEVELSPVTLRLATVISSALPVLSKHWAKSVSSEQEQLLASILSLLSQAGSTSSNGVSSVQADVAAAAVHLLCSSFTSKLDLSELRSVVTVSLARTCAQLQVAIAPESDPADLGAQELRLQVATVLLSLLERLLFARDFSDESWLEVAQSCCLFQTLLTSAANWMSACVASEYVSLLLHLLLSIANSSTRCAEALVISGLTQHTCLPLLSTYSDPHRASEWQPVFVTYLRLCSTVLQSTGHMFVASCAEMAGVHQERLVSSLLTARSVFSATCLKEAHNTLLLLVELSKYREMWLQQSPAALENLMSALCSLCHSAVAMLLRPRLVAYLIKRDAGLKDAELTPADLANVGSLLTSPGSDSDLTLDSEQLGNVIHSLLELVSTSLTALLHFSPPLTRVLLDESLDVLQYRSLVHPSFAAPAPEAASSPTGRATVAGVTFGTLVSCVTQCLRFLSKLDVGRLGGASPARSPVAQLSATSTLDRRLLNHTMETALGLTLSQAVLGLRDPRLTRRERQRLRKELNSELSTVVVSLQRYYRRSAAGGHSPSSALVSPRTSPAPSRTPPTTGPRTPLQRLGSQLHADDPPICKLAHAVVIHILQ